MILYTTCCVGENDQQPKIQKLVTYGKVARNKDGAMHYNFLDVGILVVDYLLSLVCLFRAFSKLILKPKV